MGENRKPIGTNLEKSEILEIISKSYNLGKISSLKKFDAKNVRSQKWKFQNQSEKFLVTRIQENVDPRRMEKILKIQNLCVKKKLPIQNPIKNNNKKFFNNKNYFYITTYYKGELYKGTKPQILNISKKLAILHRYFKKSKINEENLNLKNYNLLSQNEIKKILKQKPIFKVDNIIQKDLEFINELILKQKNQKRKINFLSKQLIHNDLHPRNVLFKNSNVKVILDFNSMKFGYRMEDLVLTSFRFANFYENEEKKIERNIRVFIENYLKWNKIPKKEINLYNYFLKEYLLTRISHIIRNRFILNNDVWLKDYSMFMKFMNKAKKITYED